VQAEKLKRARGRSDLEKSREIKLRLFFSFFTFVKEGKIFSYFS